MHPTKDAAPDFGHTHCLIVTPNYIQVLTIMLLISGEVGENLELHYEHCELSSSTDFKTDTPKSGLTLCLNCVPLKS